MPESSVLTSLRETLRAVPGDGHSRRRIMPFGVPDIDTRLTDGGLRLDALHEIAAATPSLRDDAAATLFVAGIAARAWGPILWVVRRRDLFAPALAQSGLLSKRVIHAEADDDAGVLALMEEGLRHPALGAVIGEVRRASPAATKRVQLSAARGRTVALLLKRPARGSGDPFAVSSPAATRWRIGTVPMVGTTRPRWEVTLARQADGAPFTATAIACDDTGRLAPMVTRREQRRAVSEILRVTPLTEEQAEAA
ncbi:ImuA family protein [Sphingomonas phyllosphaerae]|uniref:ImuA family protein n=1 Tax=Sphingomonas phyllosphaerae TaxID=257003 RepID=UPI000423EA4D|nr:protein ImuA [Sphingomonas phyllosphaerae]